MSPGEARASAAMPRSHTGKASFSNVRVPPIADVRLTPDSRSMYRKPDKLYLQALNIRERRAPGLWLPRIWTLALRGHADAMIELAGWLSGDADALGALGDGFSAAGLYRRAYRKGNARAAYNLAMT